MAVYEKSPVRRDGFASELERVWWHFFETIGLHPAYEPEKIDLGTGLVYTPDFWLPELRMWAEAKKGPTGADLERITQLARRRHCSVLICLSDGLFQLHECDDPAWGGAGLRDPGDCYLAKCNECGGYFFSNRRGSYRCRQCGAYAGDETARILYWGNGERGWVDQKSFFCRNCYPASEQHYPHTARPGIVGVP